jgi:nucleoid DNA-binding protein
MRKHEIANRLARAAHVSKSEAADRIDAIVHQIVKNLRRGDEPGSGELAELIAEAQKSAPARRNGTSPK